MKQLPHLPRWARWMVPTGVVLTVAGGLLAGSALPSAAAAPQLPARSAGQLLATVTRGHPLPAMSGTITESAALGLPALPVAALGSAAPLSAASLLAGSHTVQLWYAGPAHYRLALPQSMSETDLIRNGTSGWLWDSAANTVTHVTLPASTPVPSVSLLTPQQAAQQALAEVGPSTIVRVDRTVTVAGQAAYQLVLAPKSPASLIGQVRIAIDSRRHVPLRVQVLAKGAATAAAEVGFTAISFRPPPTADYAFTPPPGAKVTQANATASRAGTARPGQHASAGIRVIGTGWLAVAALPESSLTELTGGPGGAGPLPFQHSASAGAPGSRGAAGAGSPLLGMLLNSARLVHGSWGSGRLITTRLLSVLVTSTGRVLIGAVRPDVLYHAVTQAGHPLVLGQHASSRARPK